VTNSAIGGSLKRGEIKDTSCDVQRPKKEGMVPTNNKIDQSSEVLTKVLHNLENQESTSDGRLENPAKSRDPPSSTLVSKAPDSRHVCCEGKNRRPNNGDTTLYTSLLTHVSEQANLSPSHDQAKVGIQLELKLQSMLRTLTSQETIHLLPWMHESLRSVKDDNSLLSRSQIMMFNQLMRLSTVSRKRLAQASFLCMLL